jgi:anaerobic carbon-monoxide dehydrogenase iron sulfur subunit
MMAVERRDKEPVKKEEPKKVDGTKISRREFLFGTGAGIAGLVVGGVVGSQVFPKTVEAPAAAPAAGPAAATAAPAAAGGEAPASPYKANYTIVFDPYQCTGCMKCAVACSEKYSTEVFPEQTANTVNLEFARIRPVRFQYVDVINVCYDCKLEPWAEGSDQAPCQAVCPEEAILTIPEGEGKEGYYGMGYKYVDRDKCLGADKCWRCSEICEDQFGSGISFDPIEKKAQVCGRCGGDPECVKACPEPLALQWVPVTHNGRYFAHTPAHYAELLYRKMFNQRRTL